MNILAVSGMFTCSMGIIIFLVNVCVQCMIKFNLFSFCLYGCSHVSNVHVYVSNWVEVVI